MHQPSVPSVASALLVLPADFPSAIWQFGARAASANKKFQVAPHDFLQYASDSRLPPKPCWLMSTPQISSQAPSASVPPVSSGPEALLVALGVDALEPSTPLLLSRWTLSALHILAGKTVR